MGAAVYCYRDNACATSPLRNIHRSTFMEKTSDVYSRLYHYTNEQGLYGILENRCIWATHYKFLNDYSEIGLFREKLATFCHSNALKFHREMFSKSPHTQEFSSDHSLLTTLAEQDSKWSVDSSYNSLPEVYITSFCAENRDNYINQNGLLSQWRGYGGDGGFAIVFKTQALKEMLRSEYESFLYDCLHFGDVIYSDDEEKYQSELSEELSTIATNDTDWRLHMMGKKEEPSYIADAKAYSSFVRCVTRYKHRGFKEEQEFRIVATLIPFHKVSQEIPGYEHLKSKSEKERKFRFKNGRRTPYIELFRSLGEPLPIEKIIVGPHKDKDARAAALRVFLKDTIEVTVSEIPYIS
jgi:hypothetical protein